MTVDAWLALFLYYTFPLWSAKSLRFTPKSVPFCSRRGRRIMPYVPLCAAARRALIFTAYVPRRLLDYPILRLNQAYLAAAKGAA
jgi:hypothetical protein